MNQDIFKAIVAYMGSLGGNASKIAGSPFLNLMTAWAKANGFFPSAYERKSGTDTNACKQLLKMGVVEKVPGKRGLYRLTKVPLPDVFPNEITSVSRCLKLDKGRHIFSSVERDLVDEFVKLRRKRPDVTREAMIEEARKRQQPTVLGISSELYGKAHPLQFAHAVDDALIDGCRHGDGLIVPCEINWMHDDIPGWQTRPHALVIRPSNDVEGDYIIDAGACQDPEFRQRFHGKVLVVSGDSEYHRLLRLSFGLASKSAKS